MSYQKVVIVGNLGRDPEFRYLDTNNSSTAVANFNVATNRQYTASSGERIKETTWFRVTVWGRQAETCNEYLRTGSFGASFELTGERVLFLSTRGDTGDYGTSNAPMADEDDIPF